MNAAELNQIASILVPMGMFALVFGIVYLIKREKMAMIERGMDPRLNKPKTRNNTSVMLTTGLLLIGAGVGLLLAYILDFTVLRTINTDHDNPAIYFALISIFGGGGLFLSYRMEKKDAAKDEE